MPIDADPGDVAGTGLAVRDLTEQLRGSGAGNVILLIDACRDDGSRDGVGIGLEQQQGVITLFSCAPEQQSYEVDELQAGAFTHALLQGLRIQGEGNCATVARLAEHVRVQVPYLTQLYRKGQQNPYLVAEPVSKQNLILLPRQATPTDVLMLKNGALQAENQDDRDLARDFWLRVLSVSSGSDMEAVQAIERLASGNSARRSVGNAGGSRSVGTSLPPVISRRRLMQLGWGGLGTVGFGLVGKAWSDGQNQRPTPPSNQLASPIASETPTLRPSQSQTPKPEPQETKASSGVKLEDFQFETVQLSDRGKAIKREKLTRKWFNHQIAGDVSLPMVQIPAGKFLMGSPASEVGRSNDEGPQHEVSVSAFLMAQTPITQAQWKAIAKLAKVNIDLTEDPSKWKGDRRPVEQVSWWEAQEFCDRLSRLSKPMGLTYRLPNEAEWEYACRSSTKTPFHFGETITTDAANYRGTDWDINGIIYPANYGIGPNGTFREQTTDVETFPANPWGLHDMHGNVWEWCADHWHDSYDKAPINGSAWLSDKEDSKRRLRGGSWQNRPMNCRSAHRGSNDPGVKLNYVGFRVVCVSA
jgi:formylglycine-generating enzyme required for sulfatase activity